MVYKIKLRKDDVVVVRAGKYKGRSGKVMRIHSKTNQVTVEGINVFKKHRKPTQLQPQGGIIEITKPLPVSKVGLADKSKKASRVGYKLGQKGEKTRVYKSTGREVK